MRERNTAEVIYEDPDGRVRKLALTMDEPQLFVESQAREFVPEHGHFLRVESWPGARNDRPPQP